MMNLAEYRGKPKRLADYLPWAALVAPGIILNKDGSFQRTASFRGPDLDSATPAELIGATARLNSALRRLGSPSGSSCFRDRASPTILLIRHARWASRLWITDEEEFFPL
jgi:type IV secretory pathway VirB4 component